MHARRCPTALHCMHQSGAAICHVGSTAPRMRVESRLWPGRWVVHGQETHVFPPQKPSTGVRAPRTASTQVVAGVPAWREVDARVHIPCRITRAPVRALRRAVGSCVHIAAQARVIRDSVTITAPWLARAAEDPATDHTPNGRSALL